MKKIIFILTAFALLYSCAPKQDPQPTKTKQDYTIRPLNQTSALYSYTVTCDQGFSIYDRDKQPDTIGGKYVFTQSLVGGDMLKCNFKIGSTVTVTTNKTNMYLYIYRGDEEIYLNYFIAMVNHTFTIK